LTYHFTDTDLIPLYIIFITVLLAAILVLFYHQKDKRKEFPPTTDETRWIKVDIVSDEGIQTTTFMYGSVSEETGLSAGNMSGSDIV